MSDRSSCCSDLAEEQELHRKRRLIPVAFQWTLEDFDKLQLDSGQFIINDCLEKRLATNGELSFGDDSPIGWTLKVYPFGGSEETSRSLGLSIQWKQQSEEETFLSAFYSLKIVGQNEEENDCQQRGHFQSSLEAVEGSSGFVRLCSREDLMDPEKGFLSKEKSLTISCQINYILGRIRKDHFLSFAAISPLFDPSKSSKRHNPGNDLTQEEADFAFKVKGQQIPVHRQLLVERSSVLKELLERKANPEFVSIFGFKADVMSQLVHFLYHGSIADDSVAFDLMEAADFYALDDLQFVCQQIIYDKLDAVNAVRSLITADRCKSRPFKHLIVHFMAENSERVTSSKEWGEKMPLHPQLLVEVLHQFTIRRTSR